MATSEGTELLREAVRLLKRIEQHLYWQGRKERTEMQVNGQRVFTPDELKE